MPSFFLLQTMSAQLTLFSFVSYNNWIHEGIERCRFIRPKKQIMAACDNLIQYGWLYSYGLDNVTAWFK